MLEGWSVGGVRRGMMGEEQGGKSVRGCFMA